MSSGLAVSRASVVPRVFRAGAVEPLSIDLIATRALDEMTTGAIALVGAPGSGKTTALAHLAATIAERCDDVIYLDEPSEEVIEKTANAKRLIFTSSKLTPRLQQCKVMELAPWCDDDLVEFLLTHHRDRCKSVMQRIRNDGNRGLLDGSPQLWRIVLNQMLADDSIETCAAALSRHFDDLLQTNEMLESAGAIALRMAKRPRDESPDLYEIMLSRPPAVVAPLLRHRAVQVLLAAERIVWNLAQAINFDDLADRFPRDLLHAIATRVEHRPAAIQRLNALATGTNWGFHAMAASILVAAQPNWNAIGVAPFLPRAYLSGASWPDRDLHDADLTETDFARANLSRANLTGAKANSASFARASLREATLTSLRGAHADFASADLAGAILTGAMLMNANFDRAMLDDASIDHASLNDAHLNHASLRRANAIAACVDGAELHEADLSLADFSRCKAIHVNFSSAKLFRTIFARGVLCNCIFSGVMINKCDFNRCDFTGSDLTGSQSRKGMFSGAMLCNCGLAEIDWPNADLQYADFTNASFHLGSTRSGLVGSTLASEGSRTGFYTDEYGEQDFKSPEEIRKANLCGANLLGAKVDGTDWYLVDLRGAKYSTSQAQYFKRCGAILHSRG